MEHFGSLSVYYKDVLQIRAPSITTENVLQFIRQCNVTYSSSENTVTNFCWKFTCEYKILVLITCLVDAIAAIKTLQLNF